MNEFFDLMFDVALADKTELLTNDTEYQEFMKHLMKLSEEYKQLDLTEKQRQVIDVMIDTQDFINMKEMLVIYKKGILHSIEILKNLQLLK